MVIWDRNIPMYHANNDEMNHHDYEKPKITVSAQDPIDENPEPQDTRGKRKFVLFFYPVSWSKDLCYRRIGASKGTCKMPCCSVVIFLFFAVYVIDRCTKFCRLASIKR